MDGYGISDTMFSPEYNRILMICRELLGREKQSEKSPLHAREIIRRLIEDPLVDLLSLFAPQFNNPDHPYYIAYELLNAKSVFFETILDSDEILSRELWAAIADLADRSTCNANYATESLLMRVLAEWTIRLLPVDVTGTAVPTRVQTKSRIHTPLDLFLRDSPLLNRISMDSTTPMQSYGNSLQPRHISMISNFIITLCSTNQFPAINRIVIVRYLVKQFHIFCQHPVPDSELMSIKAAILTRPAFSVALYNFLYNTMEICPSENTFKDLIDVWLAFCRPWRYDDDARMRGIVALGQYVQFIHNHDKFYTVLMGKMLRRMRELGVGGESIRVITSLLECCWKEPLAEVFRRLGVDPRPPCALLVEYLKERRNEDVRVIENDKQRVENLSWWDQLTAPCEDERVRKAKASAEGLTHIIREAEDHLKDVMKPNQSTENAATPECSMIDSPTCALSTTPRSRHPGEPLHPHPLLPDHEVDAITGLMYLTPEGRRQVVARERSFDFSPCSRVIPPVLKNITSDEWAWLSRQLYSLSVLISQTPPIRHLTERYHAHSLIGVISRQLLNPPCPNPSAVGPRAPVFCKLLPVTPPLLNLRPLARYHILAFISLLFVSVVVSPYFLFLLPLAGIVTLLCACASE